MILYVQLPVSWMTPCLHTVGRNGRRETGRLELTHQGSAPDRGRSLMPTIVVLGRVFDEERRVVVRRDAVGDPDVRAPAPVRRAHRRTGARQLRALLPRGRRRGGGGVGGGRAGGARPAGQLSSRDLRPDGGVLERRGGAEAGVPRGAHVSAEEELGLQRRRRTTHSIQERHRRRRSVRLETVHTHSRRRQFSTVA